MKFWHWLAAGAALTAGTRAPAADPLDAFHAALERSDLLAAAKLFNARRAQAPATPTGKRDPLLDHMAGEIDARVATPFPALAYLLHARDGAATPAEQAELSLWIGNIHARSGKLDEAAASYRAALAEPPSTTTGRSARNALAQLQLARAPEEVEALLGPVIAAAARPDERWEAELIASRAAALLGDNDKARQRLAAAWADAPAAPGQDQALRRTAQDIALDAFAAGNRRQALSLEEIARNSNALDPSIELPRCGAGGLRHDDRVVVEAAWDGRRFGYSPVRASRPGIARPFIDALAGHQPRLGAPPVLFVTLRCSTFSTPFPIRTPAVAGLDWIAEKGIYPYFNTATDLPGAVAEVQEEINRIERRSGANSVALVPPLFSLALNYVALAQVEANGGYIARARETAERALALLKAANAPTGATLWLERDIRSGRLADPSARGDMTAIVTKAYDEDAALNGNDSTVMVRWAIAAIRQEGFPLALKMAIGDRAVATLAAGKVPLSSPEGQALVSAYVGVLREKGDTARIASLARAAKLPADLCELAEETPDLSPESVQLIGPDQYPTDALQTMLEGMTTLTMDLDATGHPRNLRVLSAHPPEVFDAVTLERARLFLFSPAKVHGKPVACSGVRQRIRWNIPTGEEAPITPPPS